MGNRLPKFNRKALPVCRHYIFISDQVYNLIVNFSKALRKMFSSPF